MHGVHQPTPRDRQPVLLLKQRGDLPEGEPQLFVEDDRERDRLRAELRARRAKCVGGLQRMAALHPPLARATLTDMNPKRPHDDARHRQFLLILQRHPRLANGPAALGTLAGQWRFVGLIDAARPAPTRFHPIVRSWFAARSPGVPRERLREWSRLPARRAARLVKLPFQSVIFSAESISFTFRAVQLPARRSRSRSAHSARSRSSSTALGP